MATGGGCAASCWPPPRLTRPPLPPNECDTIAGSLSGGVCCGRPPDPAPPPSDAISEAPKLGPGAVCKRSKHLPLQTLHISSIAAGSPRLLRLAREVEQVTQALQTHRTTPGWPTCVGFCGLAGHVLPSDPEPGVESAKLGTCRGGGCTGIPPRPCSTGRLLLSILWHSDMYELELRQLALRAGLLVCERSRLLTCGCCWWPGASEVCCGVGCCCGACTGDCCC